jgi:hypothetical protein
VVKAGVIKAMAVEAVQVFAVAETKAAIEA